MIMARARQKVLMSRWTRPVQRFPEAHKITSQTVINKCSNRGWLRKIHLFGGPADWVSMLVDAVKVKGFPVDGF